MTVRKWRSRADVQNRSHRPHRLQTGFGPLEERLICELRAAIRQRRRQTVNVHDEERRNEAAERAPCRAWGPRGFAMFVLVIRQPIG